MAEGSYFYDAVLWAANHNPQITNGTDKGIFEPFSDCTRAQAITFLYRAAGAPDVSGVDISFTDVPEDAYYANAVKWAVKNGITTGTSENEFSPDETATRAQVVTFLYRAAGSPGVDSAGTSFSDVPENEFYASAVKWAVANGITNGTSETEFSPNETCQRAQIVTFLYRADA